MSYKLEELLSEVDRDLEALLGTKLSHIFQQSSYMHFLYLRTNVYTHASGYCRVLIYVVGRRAYYQQPRNPKEGT